MSRKTRLPEGFLDVDFRRPYLTSSSPRGRIRCLAMIHLQSQKLVEEVADIVQQSCPTIYTWLRWFKEGGLSRLVENVQGRGRKSKLSGDNALILKEMILQAHEKREGGRLLPFKYICNSEAHWLQGHFICLSPLEQFRLEKV